MKLRKLSEITPAPPVSPNDQIVGVIGGTTDALMSLIQLHDLVDATGDLDFYVATTGSDSNPGTIGSPFLTIQYALNVASAYNYLGMYFPIIHVADGTYTLSSTIVLRELTGGISGNSQGFISCNPANPGNVVIDDSAVGPDNELFAALDPASNWQVDGFQGNTTGPIFLAVAGGKITCAHDIIVNDPTEGGLLYVFDLQDAAVGRLNAFVTVSFLSTIFSGFCQAQNYANYLMSNNTINLQVNSISGNGIYFSSGYSEIVDINSTYTGTAGLLSSGSVVGAFCLMATINGLASDVPDGLSIHPLAVFGSGAVQFPQQQILSAPPTSGDLPVPNSWNMFYNSNLGTPYLTTNVDSIVFATPLAGNAEGTPFQITIPTTGGTVTSLLLLKSNILTPAGTLATLTVNLPFGPGGIFAGIPPDGFTTRVSSSQTITAITFATTDGSAIFSAPSTLPANTSVGFVFSANLGPGTWFVM